MEKRAEYLATLGLSPDASWDEVTQAYKDLMRVWHPDRFQGDERLRKKAELQAQQINHAMGELRKLGKNPPKQTARQSASTSTATANATNHTHRTQQNHSQHHTAGNAREAQSQHASFLIAPLYVRQRFTTSIFRVVAASIIFYVAFDSLRHGNGTTSQEAASLAFMFLSIDFGVRNLTVMLLPKPLISVERNGLFFLKTGRLGWADLERAWPVMTPRTQQISLLLSEHYVRKQNMLTGILLRFRRWMKAPHVTVPCNGLTMDPVSIINAMRLRQIHHDITVEEPSNKPRSLLFIATLISMVCISIALIRCMLELTATPLEYLPYLILFSLSRASSLGIRILST